MTLFPKQVGSRYPTSRCGADDGTRTHTVNHQILNLARLPIPPHRLEGRFLTPLRETPIAVALQGTSPYARFPQRRLMRNWAVHQTPFNHCLSIISFTAQIQKAGFVRWFVAPRILVTVVSAGNNRTYIIRTHICIGKLSVPVLNIVILKKLVRKAFGNCLVCCRLFLT